MSAISKVVDTINKDVANENETKTTAVITRVLAIIICIYSLFHMTFAAIAGVKILVFISLAAFAIFLTTFLLSYANNTKATMMLMNAMLVIYVLAVSNSISTESQVSLLLVVDLVYFFATSHWKMIPKVIYGVFLFCVKISIFLVVTYMGWAEVLSYNQANAFAFINNIAAFTMLTAIMLIFAQAVLQAEAKLIKTNEKIKHMAEIDPLTNLMNRRAIMEILERFEKDAHRGKRFCIAIGDIDHFKSVNDTYGHEAGDEVLKMAAALFEKKMEGAGKIARWGGEEFLFILEDMDIGDAREKLNQIRMALTREEVNHQGTIISISMTFGLSEFRASESLDAIINEADKKLYVGKESGRNRVVVSL